MTPVTGSTWPIRSACDEASIRMPSPRLPATVDPLAMMPMSLPWTVMPEPTSVTPAPAARIRASDSSVDPSEPAANRRPRVPVKFTVTTGEEPPNVGAEVPSIVNGPVIAGNALRPTLIVPLTVKSIVSGPGWAFAERIACRSEPAPEACRFDTLNVDSSSRVSRTSTRQTLERLEAGRLDRAEGFLGVRDENRSVSGGVIAVLPSSCCGFCREIDLADEAVHADSSARWQ